MGSNNKNKAKKFSIGGDLSQEYQDVINPNISTPEPTKLPKKIAKKNLPYQHGIRKSENEYIDTTDLTRENLTLDDVENIKVGLGYSQEDITDFKTDRSSVNAIGRGADAIATKLGLHYGIRKDTMDQFIKHLPGLAAKEAMIRQEQKEQPWREEIHAKQLFGNDAARVRDYIKSNSSPVIKTYNDEDLIGPFRIKSRFSELASLAGVTRKNYSFNRNPYARTEAGAKVTLASLTTIFTALRKRFPDLTEKQLIDLSFVGHDNQEKASDRLYIDNYIKGDGFLVDHDLEDIYDYEINPIPIDVSEKLSPEEEIKKLAVGGIITREGEEKKEDNKIAERLAKITEVDGDGFISIKKNIDYLGNDISPLERLFTATQSGSFPKMLSFLGDVVEAESVGGKYQFNPKTSAKGIFHFLTKNATEKGTSSFDTAKQRLRNLKKKYSSKIGSDKELKTTFSKILNAADPTDLSYQEQAILMFADLKMKGNKLGRFLDGEYSAADLYASRIVTTGSSNHSRAGILTNWNNARQRRTGNTSNNQDEILFNLAISKEPLPLSPAPSPSPSPSLRDESLLEREVDNTAVSLNEAIGIKQLSSGGKLKSSWLDELDLTTPSKPIKLARKGVQTDPVKIAKKAATKAKQVVKSVEKKAKSVVKSVVPKVKRTVRKVKPAIKSKAKSVDNLIDDIIEPIKNTYYGTKDLISDAYRGTKDYFYEGFEDVGDTYHGYQLPVNVFDFNEIQTDEAVDRVRVFEADTSKYFLKNTPGSCTDTECTSYITNNALSQQGGNFIDKLNFRGNGWTMQSNIEDAGGVSIGNIFDHQGAPTTFNQAAVKRFTVKELNKPAWKNLLRDNLKPGDYVSLYYPKSSHFSEAYRESGGRTMSTHGGEIVSIKGVLHVRDNVSGKLHYRKLEDVLNNKEKDGVRITGAVTPRVEEHESYYESEGLQPNEDHEHKPKFGNLLSRSAARALGAIEANKEKLQQMYNLSDADFYQYKREAQATMMQESQYGRAEGNDKYNLDAGKSIFGTVAYWGKKYLETQNLASEMSYSLGNIKFNTNYTEEDLKKFGFYEYTQNTIHPRNRAVIESPEFSGVATFVHIMETNKKLETLLKDANYKGSDDTKVALRRTAHNQGLDNIAINIGRYKETRDINELDQYNAYGYPSGLKLFTEYINLDKQSDVKPNADSHYGISNTASSGDASNFRDDNPASTQFPAISTLTEKEKEGQKLTPAEQTRIGTNTMHSGGKVRMARTGFVVDPPTKKKDNIASRQVYFPAIKTQEQKDAEFRASQTSVSGMTQEEYDTKKTHAANINNYNLSTGHLPLIYANDPLKFLGDSWNVTGMQANPFPTSEVDRAAAAENVYHPTRTGGEKFMNSVERGVGMVPGAAINTGVGMFGYYGGSTLFGSRAAGVVNEVINPVAGINSLQKAVVKQLLPKKTKAAATTIFPVTDDVINLPAGKDSFKITPFGEGPRLHLMSTFPSNTKGLHNQVAKDGTINVANALRYIGNNEGPVKLAMAEKALGKGYPETMKYDDFVSSINSGHGNIIHERLPGYQEQLNLNPEYGIRKVGLIGAQSDPSATVKRLTEVIAIKERKVAERIANLSTDPKLAELKQAVVDIETMGNKDIPALRKHFKNDTATEEKLLRGYDNILRVAKQTVTEYSAGADISNGLHRIRRQLDSAVKLQAANPTHVNTHSVTLSDKNIPGGNSTHGPNNTLGHLYFSKPVDDSSVAYMTQLQSNWAQEPSTRVLFNTKQLTANIENKKEYIQSLKDLHVKSWTRGVNLGPAQESLKKLEFALKNSGSALSLVKGHQKRYLQEAILAAAKDPDVKILRIPTGKTSGKIQNYDLSVENRDVNLYTHKEEVRKLKEDIDIATNKLEMFTKINENGKYDKKIEVLTAKNKKNKNKLPSAIKRLDKLVKKYDKNPDGAVYETSKQSVVDKYEAYPKILKALGIESKEVIIKGESWLEIVIPDSYKAGNPDMLAFKPGGILYVK